MVSAGPAIQLIIQTVLLPIPVIVIIVDAKQKTRLLRQILDKIVDQKIGVWQIILDLLIVTRNGDLLFNATIVVRIHIQIDKTVRRKIVIGLSCCIFPIITRLGYITLLLPRLPDRIFCIRNTPFYFSFYVYSDRVVFGRTGIF